MSPAGATRIFSFATPLSSSLETSARTRNQKQLGKTLDGLASGTAAAGAQDPEDQLAQPVEHGGAAPQDRAGQPTEAQESFRAHGAPTS